MASFNLRTLFLIIHVMAAGMVFAQIPIEIILRRIRARQAGTPAELGTLLLQGQLNASLGAIGGMGLLISGLALSFISPLGVLGIGGSTPAWLVIKQINYLIILVVLMALLQPLAKRIMPAFAQAAQSASTVTDDVRAQYSRLQLYSLIINALVVVNIVLGLWQPRF
jgi:hypothetical protein